MQLSGSSGGSTWTMKWMCSKSMPRETTSVASSTPLAFPRNSSMMRFRLRVLSLPWMPKTLLLRAGKAAKQRSRSLVQQSTQAQVLRKTMILAFPMCSCRKLIRKLSFSRRSLMTMQVFCRLLGMTQPFTFSGCTTLPSGLVSMALRLILARFLMPKNSKFFCCMPWRVAENMAVRLSFWTLLMSSSTPFSLRTRSASSTNRYSTFLSHSPSICCPISRSLPTVPISTYTPSCTRLRSASNSLPPVAQQQNRRYTCALSLSGSPSSSLMSVEQDCWQSSRVGETSRQRTLTLERSASGSACSLAGSLRARYFWRSGMRKERVLPLPVCASTARSQFLSSSGMAASCTGNIVAYLLASREAVISSRSSTWISLQGLPMIGEERSYCSCGFATSLALSS